MTLTPLEIPSNPLRVDDDILTAEEERCPARIGSMRYLIEEQRIVGPVEVLSGDQD